MKDIINILIALRAQPVKSVLWVYPSRLCSIGIIPQEYEYENCCIRIGFYKSTLPANESGQRILDLLAQILCMGSCHRYAQMHLANSRGNMEDGKTKDTIFKYLD